VILPSRIPDALRSFDVAAAAREYAANGGLVFRERFLGGDHLAELVGETRRHLPRAHRSTLFSKVRRGKVVSWHDLREQAPAIAALYRAPAMRRLVSDIVGKEVFLKGDGDGHCCALYIYDRAGDHVHAHRDDCGCGDDVSYTVLIGMIHDTRSRLFWRTDEAQPYQDLALVPGSVAIFSGSRIDHGVSPLADGEQRVVLSLSYQADVTVSRRDRLSENVKDAAYYFGPRALLQRNYRWGLRSRRAERCDHVLITGASSGIGAAVAAEYARRGSHLALVARGRERLQATAERCLALGAAEVRTLLADVSVRADVDRALAGVADWPRIDRAYLNAGSSDRQGGTPAFWECCAEDSHSAGGFDAGPVGEVMRTNYLGAVYFLAPILARMRAQRSGAIAVTGSLSVDGMLVGSGPYSASKTALRSLLDGLRHDAARMAVQVTLIEPGFITTETVIDYKWAPFVRTAAQAAARFVAGVERGEELIRYPWQMSMLVRSGKLLPRPIREAFWGTLGGLVRGRSAG
jgi:NADP-dependent 3-hydroxy acid dehydrogenase YdfG